MQPVVQPEPQVEEPQSRAIPTVSEPEAESSPPTSWSSTGLAFGDATSSVRRIFEEPHYLDTAKTCTEPDLVMDLLQEVRPPPHFPFSNTSNGRFPSTGA